MNTHNITRQFSLLKIIAVCTLLTGGTIKPSGGSYLPVSDQRPGFNEFTTVNRTVDNASSSKVSTSTKLQRLFVEKARSGFSLVKENSWTCSMIATAYVSRSLWQDTFTSVVHTSATVAFNCIKENRSSVVASIAYLTMESSMHLLDLLLTTPRCIKAESYGNPDFSKPFIETYDTQTARNKQPWNSIFFEWFKIIVPLAITLGSTYYSKDDRSTKAAVGIVALLIKLFNDRTVLMHLIPGS